MAQCEKLEKCPFYQGYMDMEVGLGAMYKKKYCESDKMSCARYQIVTALGPEFVNNSIYPNMNALANKLIAENKK